MEKYSTLIKWIEEPHAQFIEELKTLLTRNQEKESRNATSGNRKRKLNPSYSSDDDENEKNRDNKKKKHCGSARLQRKKDILNQWTNTQMLNENTSFHQSSSSNNDMQSDIVADDIETSSAKIDSINLKAENYQLKVKNDQLKAENYQLKVKNEELNKLLSIDAPTLLRQMNDLITGCESSSSESNKIPTTTEAPKIAKEINIKNVEIYPRSNVFVTEQQWHDAISRYSANSMVRSLLMSLFDDGVLTNSNFKGGKSKVGDRVTRPPLDSNIMGAIIDCVLAKYPSTPKGEFGRVVNAKCGELRFKQKRNNIINL